MISASCRTSSLTGLALVLTRSGHLQGEARVSRGTDSDGDSVDSQLTQEARRQELAGASGTCARCASHGHNYFRTTVMIKEHVLADVLYWHLYHSIGCMVWVGAPLSGYRKP